jgi:hypothetical protein
MSMQPKGEDLRKAIKWISEQRKGCPDRKAQSLINEASLKFDLPPKDQEFLFRYICDETRKGE